MQRNDIAAEHQERPGAAVAVRIGRHVDRAERTSRLAFSDETHLIVLAELDEILELGGTGLVSRAERAIEERLVGRKQLALGVNSRRKHSGGGEVFSDTPLQALDRGLERIARRGFREAPQH